MLLLSCSAAARRQVNSGSPRADAAFNPATNTVVDMSDHPTGIYHYTAVNIPAGVTVTFIPNANNTPVVWLAPGTVVIADAVDVSGQHPQSGPAKVGGIGGTIPLPTHRPAPNP